MNFGNPEKPAVMWQFKECVRGMSEACSAFNTPVVSGNVSFYNESSGVAIYPTPVVGMLGLIDNTLLNGGAPYDGTGYRTDIGKMGNVGHSALGAPGISTQGGTGNSSR